MAHPGLGFLFLIGAGIAAAVGLFFYTERQQQHNYGNSSTGGGTYSSGSTNNSWTHNTEGVKKRRRSVGEKDCSICISTDKKCDFKIPQCGHQFHLTCLLKWVENQKTCPNCRASLNDTFLQ